MKNEYSYTTIVNSHDTDIYGIVRPSCLLKYLQEAANYQIAYSHPSSEDLRAEGRHFVTSKLSLTVHEPLNAWDQIRVTTWACPSRGATFNRSSVIERDGQICATLASAWALLDATDNSIVRVSDVDFDFGVKAPVQPKLSLKVRIPREIPLYLIGEHTVGYADVDLNRHMNNTVYADVLYGHLKESDYADCRIAALSINYLHEAPFGSSFKIYSNSFAGLSYFRTVLADGNVGVEALFRFVPLRRYEE